MQALSAGRSPNVSLRSARAAGAPLLPRAETLLVRTAYTPRSRCRVREPPERARVRFRARKDDTKPDCKPALSRADTTQPSAFLRARSCLRRRIASYPARRVPLTRASFLRADANPANARDKDPDSCSAA